MSGAGAADTTLNPEDYTGFKLAIVAASWHTQVMEGLLDGAQRAAADAGLEPTIVRVPGTLNYLLQQPVSPKNTMRLLPSALLFAVELLTLTSYVRALRAV